MSLRKTLADCCSSAALEYIGADTAAPEAIENLEFHSKMVLAQLSSLLDLDTYHVSYPWRVVGLFDPSCKEMILKDMKKIWSFCTGFVDGLRNKDKMHFDFAFTRHQSFIDVMIKAESFGFSYHGMKLHILDILLLQHVAFVK